MIFKAVSSNLPLGPTNFRTVGKKGDFLLVRAAIDGVALGNVRTASERFMSFQLLTKLL